MREEREDKRNCPGDDKEKMLEHKLAYKCPETLGNKGLSGTLCFDESDGATLLQLIMKECKEK